MKLLIQPEVGICAARAAIKKAKKSVEIVIFRFDRAELEAGLNGRRCSLLNSASVRAFARLRSHGDVAPIGVSDLRRLPAV